MDLDQALEYYLEVRTGDLATDLVAAAREAARRRKEGPEATAAILDALHHQFGLTYDEIAEASYDHVSGARITAATAQRLVVRRGT